MAVLRVFRLLRLVRLVRLLRFLKELWLLVSGLLESLRILSWTMLMLFIVVYIYAVLGRELFGSSEELAEECATAAAHWQRLECPLINSACC